MRYLSKKEMKSAIDVTKNDLVELEKEVGREDFLQIFENYDPSEDDCPPSNLVFSLFEDFYCPNYSEEQKYAHLVAGDYILDVWKNYNRLYKMMRPREQKLQTQWNRFRTRAKERDNYKCVECGTNKNLCVHHIKSRTKFPELVYDMENVITLCRDCHAKKHQDKQAFIMGKP